MQDVQEGRALLRETGAPSSPAAVGDATLGAHANLDAFCGLFTSIQNFYRKDVLSMTFSQMTVCEGADSTTV